MKSKTLETFLNIGIEISISLLGFSIGALAGVLFLDWMSQQANQDKVQTCEDGWYSYTDRNVINNVYLEAMDTCKEK